MNPSGALKNVTGGDTSFTLEETVFDMEVHFTPELEKKLNDLAAQSGRAAGELVQDAVAGYVDELADTRAILDRRDDEIKSGKVKLIPGEEAFARLHERTDARCTGPA